MSPGRPDRVVVRRHLLALDRAVQHLRGHQGLTAADLDDLDRLWTVERGLQLCAQNALDVATHLVASAGLDAPDYATAIDRLGELGVLPGRFARRFRTVAGFRNVVVHAYLDVDRGVLVGALNDRLEDFSRFAEHVEAWLGG